MVLGFLSVKNHTDKHRDNGLVSLVTHSIQFHNLIKEPRMTTKEPYIARVKVGNFDCTSVILDQEEFDENMDTIKGVICRSIGERAGEEQIQALKKAGHLPLCAKGTKTIHLFEKYGVTTDMLTMAVRGIGKRIVAKIQEGQE